MYKTSGSGDYPGNITEEKTFTDETHSPVSIYPYPKESSSSESVETQTSNETTCQDAEQQTNFTRTAEVQVEPLQTSGLPKYDEEALATFLKRICPKVLKELDKSNKSKAFTTYKPPGEEPDNEFKRVLSLQKPKTQFHHDLNGKVSSLSWSCTGGSVALGFSSRAHENWCSHAGFIYIYNVIRNTGQLTATPSRVLEATSCVTDLAMHPTKPSMLVSGLYRGSVVLWDLQRDENECVATVSVHNDPVTSIDWIDLGDSRPCVVSTGQDGRMHIWNHSRIDDSLTLKESYVLSGSDTSIDPGITCFDFSLLRDVFVAALEGGRIVHCSRSYATPATRVGSEIPLKNPVLGEVEGHKGLVTSIRFSFDKGEVFLTSGTDQEIHIYSLLQVAPLNVIWCGVDILGALWCPGQSNAVIIWGHMSKMTVYEIPSGQILSTLEMEGSSTLCAAEYCMKSPGLIAVADIDGSASVWNLPLQFEEIS